MKKTSKKKRPKAKLLSIPMFGGGIEEDYSIKKIEK